MSHSVLSDAEKKRRELIITVQGLYKQGIPIMEIARRTGKERKTVKKYVDGDPDLLCRSKKRSPLDRHTCLIIKLIKEGETVTEITRQIKDGGNYLTLSNIRKFILKVAKEHDLEIAKYRNTVPPKCGDGIVCPKMDYITRKGIFNHLWMNIDLPHEYHDFLWTKYGSLPELETCIREFREIFKKKSMPRLYLFIDHYSKSKLKEISSFAKGLAKDINAVENAVASSLSNGFVEGSNSKVKTIKKMMYGRCGKLLLEAKLMYAK